jgi:4,4'-diaponeurosporenoate glycosyltransferase
MIWTAISAAGILAGALLLRRVPKCGPVAHCDFPEFSIIIPARNEATNLPILLGSIAESRLQPVETLVIDDASTDNTAAIAKSFGARVLPSNALPHGWTGKTWACYQGAKQSKTDLLLFLDADVSFLPGGLERVITTWSLQCNPKTVLSILPYHNVSAVYEQLSIIFNLLMAAGAGSFGVFSSPRLFGQSLLISKQLYFEVGGHQSVKGFVLENLRLAHLLHRRQANIVPLVGQGTIQMRMFSEGFQQMTRSWSKAFLQGAKDSSKLVVFLSVYWISALWFCPLLVIGHSSQELMSLVVVYLVLALQLYLVARQLGKYHLLTCLLYPIPLAYYCIVFGMSMINQATGRKTLWKGRQV